MQTVIEANYDENDSVATFIPFLRVEQENGKSYSRASGIYPTGRSPKSVNLAFENCNLSLLITVDPADF